MGAIQKCTRPGKAPKWHFGLKAHIRVNQESGLVHTLVKTVANVSDISQRPALLHGQEEAVWTDTGYVATWQYKMARYAA